jgi:hypothetical protein
MEEEEQEKREAFIWRAKEGGRERGRENIR